jgi:lysophospholipid acyltransferase (LPLAT)-like uncharacterized protein
VREKILGFIAWLGYRLLSITWRVKVEEPESMREALRDRRPFILAHWHGDEFAVLHLVKRYRVATLTSHSRDGRIMGVLLRLMGAKVCAGSSSRGGAGGLKALMRLSRQGFNCSFAVDGPRGPIHKVKPGVLELSRVLGCPTYYPTISCDRAYFLHSAWDQGIVPKPFARLSIRLNGPVPPVGRDQNPRNRELQQQLERLMLEATRQGSVPDQRVTAGQAG